MTEDAAVFGGLQNMIDGLQNSHTLYNPKAIAVSTTCMAEVIGDDLQAFIAKAKQQGSVPQDFDVPYAHTPAFQGSHVDGYDNMLEGILKHYWTDATPIRDESINIIPGFDGFCVGNIREMKRMLDLMGVSYRVVCDPSDVYDTPANGTFEMYAGGTTAEEAKAAINAKATISLQEYCTKRSLALFKDKEQETAALHYPLGVAATDEFLMKVSEFTGKPIPPSFGVGARAADRRDDQLVVVHPRQDLQRLRRPGFLHGRRRLHARTRRRAGARARHQRQQALGEEDEEDARRLALRHAGAGMARQGPLAHALAADDRAVRSADRQQLRQVP